MAAIMRILAEQALAAMLRRDGRVITAAMRAIADASGPADDETTYLMMSELLALYRALA